MVTEAPEIVNQTCRECGEPFKLELNPELAPKWRAFAKRTIRLCDPCGDLEAERFDAEERERVARLKRQSLESRLDDSGLPEIFKGLTFDDLERDPDRIAAIEAAERWASGQTLGLILSGKVGVGKSRIAATAVNRMLLDRAVDWVSMPELMIVAKAGIGSDEHGDMTRMLTGKRALVIDDIDKTKMTEFALSIILQAVESRTSNRLPLCVTTNLTAKELQARVGEAIYSRLIGYGEGFPVAGRDRRQDSASE